MENRKNFIVEILTPTPRRLTPYRGRTADGRLGLIVGGLYYQTAIIEVPGIAETDAIAPVRCTLSIGNASNAFNDLFTDSVNFKAAVTIQRCTFTGTWDPAFPPTVAAAPWFEGVTGTPALRGERLVLECVADLGRRGVTPRTRSRSLLLNHAPLAQGQKLTITMRR